MCVLSSAEDVEKKVVLCVFGEDTPITLDEMSDRWHQRRLLGDRRQEGGHRGGVRATGQNAAQRRQWWHEPALEITVRWTVGLEGEIKDDIDQREIRDKIDKSGSIDHQHTQLGGGVVN